MRLRNNPKANEIAFNIELQGDIYQRSRLNITKSIKQKLILKVKVRMGVVRVTEYLTPLFLNKLFCFIYLKN